MLILIYIYILQIIKSVAKSTFFCLQDTFLNLKREYIWMNQMNTDYQLVKLSGVMSVGSI